MRSISTKLILAFLSIGIISVAVIAFTAVWYTRAAFIRFLSDENQYAIAADLAEYHQANGSWNRVETLLMQRMMNQPGMGPDQHRRRVQPFLLVDEKGVVIATNGGLQRGEKIDKSPRRRARPDSPRRPAPSRRRRAGRSTSATGSRRPLTTR